MIGPRVEQLVFPCVPLPDIEIKFPITANQELGVSVAGQANRQLAELYGLLRQGCVVTPCP